MLVLIYILLVLAIVFILIALFSGRKEMVLGGLQLNQEVYQPRSVRKHSVLANIFPFTPIILGKLKLEAGIKNRLAAGRVNLSPQEFFNIKLIMVILFLIATYFIFGKTMPLTFVIAAVLGYGLVDIWLSRKIAKRKLEIIRLFPETVDLLGLCIEAGLDFTSAIEWIVKKGFFSNPMVEELALVLEEIKWGKSRTQALKDMARRLNIMELNSLVQTLVQAERLGTPVAEVFSALSEDTRLQRVRRGERFAAQAPIKILIPLIFCILPVIAIVVGGPIMLQFMQGGLLQSFAK